LEHKTINKINKIKDKVGVLQFNQFPQSEKFKSNLFWLQ